MTTSILLCSEIRRGLGELFSCEITDGYTRIRTPFLYPDGDVIDLFAKEQAGGVITITDLGETLRWLRMQSPTPKRSPKQNKLIDDVLLNHGLEKFKGMIQARIRPGDDLADVVIRTAQGALRVADVWFTMRTRAVETVGEEVELFLTEKQIPFERGQTFVGRSGRIWKPDFHTRTAQRSAIVFLLSSGSRAAAKGITEHVFTALHDLSNYGIGPESARFVSLFDDTMDVWADEDFRLVGDLSLIARWSNPDEFYDLLAA